MKIRDMINEFSAEITPKGITRNSVETSNGKEIPKDKWDDFTKGETWKTYKEIYATLKKNNLLKSLTKDDQKQMDIKPGAKGKYIINTETGKKFVYDVNSKKLSKGSL